MKLNEKIICGCLLTFSILTFAATIIIVTLDLLPSINFAKTFIPSSCRVLNNKYIDMAIISGQEDCITLNNDIWWYNKLGYNDFDVAVVQHKSTSKSNNTDSFSSSSYSDSSEYSSDSSLGPNEKMCYQGLFEVEYYDDSSPCVVSNISGLWNVDLKWVNHYLNAFQIGETDKCFYQSTDNLNVNWFEPAKFSNFSIVGICVSGSFSLVCLVLFIYLYRRFRNTVKNSYIRISPDGSHIFY